MRKGLFVKSLAFGILVLTTVCTAFLTIVHAGSAPLTDSSTVPTMVGTTWKVDDDGGGNFLTINAAIAAASNWDIIEVYSGTYNENVIVQKNLTFIGIDHDLGSGGDIGKPVVQSPIYDCFQVWVGDVTIQGFNITGGRAGIYVLGYMNHRILNNTITNNEVGVWLNYTNTNELRNNTISQNTQYGIYLYPSSSNTIEDNWIENNVLMGIWIVEGSQNHIVNNFFNNINNAQDDGLSNVWSGNPVFGTNINGGYFLGGNWWSDFPFWKPAGPYDPHGMGVVVFPWHAYHIPGTAGSIDHHPLPGFEVLAFIAAFAVVLMVLRKRKRGP